MRKILLTHGQGFRTFALRGNLPSIAVGLAMALATVTLIEALVGSLIAPIFAALFGEPSLGVMSFSINGSAFFYGAFIQAAITFTSIAAAIYLFVIAPYNAYQARHGISVGIRPCPECASSISVAAKRCPRCTAAVPPASA